MRLTLLVFACFLWVAPSQGQLSADLQNRIDSLFLHLTEDGSPGASIGVVQHGELIYAKGFGLANVEYDIPNTPQTIFHMASVSKQFTAFTMVLLQDEGKLSLDDEVRTHIPELPDFGEKITIRHLIHHTSGLRDQWNLLAMAGWRLDDVITVDHIMKLVGRQEALNFSPGERYLYCNTGYTLMAEIVRRVTGQSYGEWMQETVFEPLGMENTLFYEDHEQIVPNRAYSYHQSPDGLKKSVLSYANAGATSLFTTVEDMAKWAGNFRNPVVGTPALMDMMAQRGILNSGDTIDYAFGQIVIDYKGLQRIGHGGADAGYRTYFGRFPTTDYDVIVLSNLANGNPMGLAMQVSDILLADHITEPADSPEEKTENSSKWAFVDMPVRKLKQYAGEFYFKDVGITMTTRMEGDSLYLKQEWNGIEYAIAPASDSIFGIPNDESVTFVFQSFDNGVPQQIEVRQAGNVFKGLRQKVGQAPDLSQYAGTYYSPELETYYTLGVEENRLKATHQRHPDFDIQIREADEGTSNRWFFSQIAFTRDDAGSVNGMKVSCGRVLDLWFERVD
jgi:CubicO group peptidase (beta-lactamase class C family)